MLFYFCFIYKKSNYNTKAVYKHETMQQNYIKQTKTRPRLFIPSANTQGVRREGKKAVFFYNLISFTQALLWEIQETFRVSSNARVSFSIKLLVASVREV